MKGAYLAKTKKDVQGYDPTKEYEVRVGQIFTGKMAIYKDNAHWDYPEPGYKLFATEEELAESFTLRRKTV